MKFMGIITMYNSIAPNHAQATVPVIDQPDENVTNGADPIGKGEVQFGPAITAGSPRRSYRLPTP